MTLTATDDALVREAEPGKNYGQSQGLTTSSGPAGRRHALARFDLGGLPVGAEIDSARLVLRSLLYSGPSVVHPAAATWAETSVTWASVAGFPLLPAVATLPAIAGVASADVRALVQDWIDGALDNHGVRLERDGAPGVVVHASRQVPDPAARPRLAVCSSCCAPPPPAPGPDDLRRLCTDDTWVMLCADLDCSAGLAQDAICGPACAAHGGLWATGCIDAAPACAAE